MSLPRFFVNVKSVLDKPWFLCACSSVHTSTAISNCIAVIAYVIALILTWPFSAYVPLHNAYVLAFWCSHIASPMIRLALCIPIYVHLSFALQDPNPCTSCLTFVSSVFSSFLFPFVLFSPSLRLGRLLQVVRWSSPQVSTAYSLQFSWFSNHPDDPSFFWHHWYCDRNCHYSSNTIATNSKRSV